MTSGIRINELRLVGPTGSDRTYGVSFRTEPGESFRPLSVIAGPASTGKTTVIDFIKYCLGDDEHPQHPEVISAVRSALLEVELNGNVAVIERAAGGSPSKFASVWHKGFADLASDGETRIPTEPPSDPDGLSQFVLSACDLEGVELPEAPTQENSPTHLLSVRDMFRVMFMPNERLDNRNLVFEQSNFMIRQKFLQSIDVMFDVHDAQGAALSQRLAAAQQASRASARSAAMIRQYANEDYPQGPLALQLTLEESKATIASIAAQLADLDARQRGAENATTSLREALNQAQATATKARVRVRDRQSLLTRLHALRAQYADDKRKLTFLKDAERLFDPLQVKVCPACMSYLAEAPQLVDGTCTLCSNRLSGDGEVDATKGGTVIEAELRALTRRLDDLNSYVDRLEEHLTILERERARADERADEAAASLDRLKTTPAPWLAVRDDLTNRLSEARLSAQSSEAGIGVWARVQKADEEHARRLTDAERIAEQRRTSRSRATRAGVVRDLSKRFGEILNEFEYPKLENPYLDEKLVPHVRNLPYTAASSGGMVLIGLAWSLALWEIAFEKGAMAPGLLVIDSPQKNLGHKSEDADFADAALVENFYSHVKSWLGNDGAGAQLIVVDNSPPESVVEDVVVRFTRSTETRPYGLITDATS